MHCSCERLKPGVPGSYLNAATSTANYLRSVTTPDKQAGAIKLVMDQMETVAPRYAAQRG